MKLKQLIYRVFLLLLLCGCTTLHTYKSVWHTDAKNTPDNVFQQENQLALKVSNDATNLYLTIFSNLPTTIQNIENLGLSVWISKGKSPQKKHGIHYPLPYADAKNKIAFENFSLPDLTAIPLTKIAPLQISATLSSSEFQYQLQIPLSELDLENASFCTIQIQSLESGKTEYLSSLTTAEEIERRLDEYKAQRHKNLTEITPFFYVFELAKMPNKTP